MITSKTKYSGTTKIICEWSTLRFMIIVCLFFSTIMLGGCLKMDPLMKHKILSTFFDGVPALPSLNELCEDNLETMFNKYYEAKIIEASQNEDEDKSISSEKKGSQHRPWKEKNCTACHNFQAKNKLKLPKTKICYLCHKNFIQGKHVHGPVSVGACLACHDPHSTSNPYLLRRSLKTICFKCHLEKRLAAKMHARVISRGMLCVNCHNPHSSNLHYFLQ